MRAWDELISLAGGVLHWKALRAHGRLTLEAIMERREVLLLLRDRQVEIRDRFGVTSLRLFGSVARDDADDDSDVDVLVGFSRPPTFRNFMQLRFFLEDLLGVRVDLVTETGLRDAVRPYVEKDAILVA